MDEVGGNVTIGYYWMNFGGPHDWILAGEVVGLVFHSISGIRV